MKLQQSLNVNDTFFNSIHKEVWKKMLPPALAIAEVDFIEEIGGLEANQKVLDVMCGYGRHALELAKRGYEVTAIDNLQDYITEINEAAKKEALPVKAICNSVLSMQLQNTYDAAICMGNSLSFFNANDALQIIKNISSHLKQGGIFIINTWMIAEIAIKYFKEKDWFYVDDYKYIIDSQYFFNPARIESVQTVVSTDGRIEEKNAVDYILTVDELRQVLSQAGLQLLEIYSTPRKRKFQFGDTKAYLVAQKL